MNHAVLHFDGGCRPTNPGPAGFACVIEFPGRKKNNEVRVAKRIRRTTNNVAEYHGLIVGIKVAVDHGAKTIEIYSDSDLVVKQVSGEWKVKSNSPMKLLWRDASDLLARHFPEGAWTIQWIPREKNSVADALCTRAILSHRQKNPILTKLGLN